MVVWLLVGVVCGVFVVCVLFDVGVVFAFVCVCCCVCVFVMVVVLV